MSRPNHSDTSQHFKALWWVSSYSFFSGYVHQTLCSLCHMVQPHNGLIPTGVPRCLDPTLMLPTGESVASFQDLEERRIVERKPRICGTGGARSRTGGDSIIWRRMEEVSLWRKGALIEVRTISQELWMWATGQSIREWELPKPTVCRHLRVSANRDEKSESKTAGSAWVQKYLIPGF